MDLPDGFFEKAAAEAERAYENSWRRTHSNWRPDWREVADVVVDVLAEHWENQNPWLNECIALKAKVIYLQKIIDDAEIVGLGVKLEKCERERDESKKSTLAWKARAEEEKAHVANLQKTMAKLSEQRGEAWQIIEKVRMAVERR